MNKIMLSLLLGLSITANAGSFTPVSSGLTGKDLPSAINAALAEASFELNADSIYAWEATLDNSEILVSVLDSTDQQLSYGCHPHGPVMVCHEEDHEQGTEVFEKDPVATLDYMKTGFSAAVTKFTKTLKRRGLDFSVVESAKVWTLAKEEDHHGHGHGHDHDEEEEEGHEHSADVWTKFHYELNGQEKEIYVQCHIEAGESDFACHYSTTGKDEIDLDSDHEEHEEEEHGHGHHGHNH